MERASISIIDTDPLEYYFPSSRFSVYTIISVRRLSLAALYDAIVRQLHQKTTQSCSKSMTPRRYRTYFYRISSGRQRFGPRFRKIHCRIRYLAQSYIGGEERFSICSVSAAKILVPKFHPHHQKLSSWVEHRSSPGFIPSRLNPRIGFIKIVRNHQVCGVFGFF